MSQDRATKLVDAVMQTRDIDRVSVSSADQELLKSYGFAFGPAQGWGTSMHPPWSSLLHYDHSGKHIIKMVDFVKARPDIAAILCTLSSAGNQGLLDAQWIAARILSDNEDPDVVMNDLWSGNLRSYR